MGIKRLCDVSIQLQQILVSSHGKDVDVQLRVDARLASQQIFPCELYESMFLLWRAKHMYFIYRCAWIRGLNNP